MVISVPFRGEALRNYTKNFMVTWSLRGMGSGEAYRTAADLGIAYRKTDFLSDYRFISGTIKRGERLRYVGKERMPSEAVFADTPYKLQTSPYLYEYTLKVLDMETGEVEERYAKIGTSRRHRIGEMEEYAWLLFDKPEEYGEMVLEVKTERGFKR